MHDQVIFMNLRFNESLIDNIANKYEPSPEEDTLIQLQNEIRLKKHIDKDQLKLVAKWKSKRSAGHIEKNSNNYVEEITSFAFSTNNERSRIEALTLLDGISWPTASAILHLFHNAPYPHP